MVRAFRSCTSCDFITECWTRLTRTRQFLLTFASPLPAIMAAPRPSLRGFLVQAKNALRNAIESSQKVTLVIGNESAGESMLLQPVARALTQIRP
jgi:hypothetical protein